MSSSSSSSNSSSTTCYFSSLKLEAKQIYPLLLLLTRYYGTLDYPYLYDNIDDIKTKMKEIPIYRSFFKHRLFDKNLFLEIKKYLKEIDFSLLIAVYPFKDIVIVYDSSSGDKVKVFGDNGRGSSNNQFYRPTSAIIDKENRLFIADSHNHRIQIFNFQTNKYICTLGKFTVKETSPNQFNYPYSLTLDSNNNLYVLENGNNRISVFDSKLNFSHFIANNNNNIFKYPDKTIFNHHTNELLVSDGGLYQILILNVEGKIMNKIGNENKSGCGNYEFNEPYQISIDNKGRIFIADPNNHRISIFNHDYKFITSIGDETEENNPENSKFYYPYSIAINKSNTQLYVADDTNRIQVFSLEEGDNEFSFLKVLVKYESFCYDLFYY